MTRELFMAFYKSTRQKKPHRIIFYRDGVSEGQFDDVLLYEMDAIRKTCKTFEEGYMPSVTFVVVQKSHHTRLFPEYHGQNTNKRTVVDKKITHPTEFDFFCAAMLAYKGQVAPHIIMSCMMRTISLQMDCKV